MEIMERFLGIIATQYVPCMCDDLSGFSFSNLLFVVLLWPTWATRDEEEYKNNKYVKQVA